MTESPTNMRINKMKQMYPFRVFVHRYLEKLKAGKAPRPEHALPEINASWIVRRIRKGDEVVDVVRAFGFTTAKDAAAFAAQWPDHGDPRWED